MLFNATTVWHPLEQLITSTGTSKKVEITHRLRLAVFPRARKIFGSPSPSQDSLIRGGFRASIHYRT